jgi:serine/threonine protein kinase
MSLAVGMKIGPYEILAPLGAGGMGEVYRARDTTLNRDVAIKILPDVVAHDADRVARFTREAQALAALNHPNIAQIYGIVETPAPSDSGGGTHVHALVMELVEGDDLSVLIARHAGSEDPASTRRRGETAGGRGFRPGMSAGSKEPASTCGIPLDDALPIARQIADALEAAHEQGIIHRDLKPANIKVRPDGTVKVLDFGLAKALGPEGTSATADAMNSPTLTARATQFGMIIGTAAYMAPEQARGKNVDKRADIWAFGVVLYEMLTGRQTFPGDDVSEVLASVLKSDPDWTVVPAGIPPSVQRLLHRCLEKDPRKRLSAIGDARFDLDEDALAAGPAPVEARRPSRRRWVPWAIAAVASIAAATMAVALFRLTPREPDRTVRFHVETPESPSQTRRGRGFEVSPDGRYLAIISAGELWVRPLDSVTVRRVEGIEGATYPFWSPDGAWIAFFADGQLKKVARDGGTVQNICDAPDGRGAAWGRDNVIIFSAVQGTRGLSRVSALGGQSTAVTQLPAAEANRYHRYPQFLPDGRSFLFQFLTPSAASAGIYVGTLDGGAPIRVLDGVDQALYAPGPGRPTGFLLYRRQNTLMAQPFDPVARRTIGEVMPVADAVGSGPNTGSGAFSVSPGGVLAFSSDWSQSGELIWVDRAGRRLGAINGESREMQGVSLARGSTRVAYGAGTPADVWVQSLPGGEPSRFTFGPAPGWAYPLWSPDGRELLYTTFDLVGFPQYEIRRRRADRGGAEEVLLQAGQTLYPWDWSPDGRFLVFSDEAFDLALLPLSGDRRPIPLLTAPGIQAFAQFSPDGRFLAYTSDQQGQSEVFVGTVPASEAVWQVSTSGGSMPRWRRDGRELFYRAVDGTLMVVSFGPGAGGRGAAAVDERSAPRPLFKGIPSSGNTPIFTYAAADDGQRFLVGSSRKTDQPPITLVVNWQAALAVARVVQRP